MKRIWTASLLTLASGSLVASQPVQATEPNNAAEPTALPPIAAADGAIAPTNGPSPADLKATLDWALYLVQANLPTKYEKSKNWGDTKRVYAGVDIDHDGLKLKTHRKYRELRHGKWLKYTIDLKDPTNPKYLKFEVLHASQSPDGRLLVSLQIDTHVSIKARQERWNYGAQVYSLSTDASARLRMTIDASIGFLFDYTQIPPAVVFDPVVDRAELKLRDLEVDRISKLGSDLAEEFGDVAERILREDYLPKQSERLPQRLNSQIDKRRDKLRISASDWLSRYIKAP